MSFNPEIRNRIRVSLAAYAYEMLNESWITDQEFDLLAQSINPTIATGNELLDTFFRDHFSADTGMWIYQHPELEKLKQLYEQLTTPTTS